VHEGSQNVDSILVVNSGSSSVKFQIFEIKGRNDVTALMKGQVDGVGTLPRIRVESATGAILLDQVFSREQVPSLPAALNEAARWLREAQHLQPVATGHRVVHGGPDHDRPIIVDGDVLAGLERYIPLAPLHQPHNLAPIKSLLKNRPQMLQVACFDTAFHRGHGPLADHYAIPEAFYTEGVRRYGFHGLSYEYIAHRLKQIAPETAKGRVITAHLGSGASMCAISDGRSIDCTMGFTALDGLPMGTRPGQLDPGVVLYLMTQKHMDLAAIEELLYQKSGLKGLSGISSDMRELEASEDSRAAFAIDYFVHRIVLHTGMLVSALDGLDAFVFTAGIGENSPIVRGRVAERLRWLGISIDAAANAANAPIISSTESRVALYVIATNEELMIAKHTASLLASKAS
jgi:acetate kinase